MINWRRTRRLLAAAGKLNTLGTRRPNQQFLRRAGLVKYFSRNDRALAMNLSRASGPPPSTKPLINCAESREIGSGKQTAR